MDIGAAVAQDAAGNDNTAASQFTIIVDTTAPAPAISGPASPTGSDPFDVTIDFGETVTGFESSDITVGNGSVGGLSDNGGGSYTASIDAASDGQVTVNVAADVAQDTAGNDNTAATQFSVTVDTTAPAPAINGPASPTGSDPFDVTIDFGESVTGFESNDITVGNGSVSGLSDNGGGSYTASIDASSDGQVTVDIGAAVAQDAAGNDNTAAAQFSVTVDTTAPAPTITGPASPTGSDPFDVTIDFGEAVSGFESGDITVGNGSVSGSLTDNGGGSYTASIDAASDGQVTVDVGAAVAQDAAGNDNTAAAQFSVIVDTTGPALTISGPSSPTGRDPFDVTIDFGESVTGFESSDITVGNGSVSGLSDNGGGSYTASIDASSDGQVTVDIGAAVAQDAAGNDNTAASQFTITVDTTAPAPTITGPANPTGNDPFDVTINFGETVTGFESSDISVSNGSVSALTDNDSGSYTASIDAASDGQVTVDVGAAVAQDAAGNDNTAASQFSVTVDTIAPAPSISGPASPTGNDPFDVTIDFSETVNGFESGDISVGNGSVSNLSDNGGGSYTASIDAASDGQVTVDVGAAVAQDAAGNDNTAASQFSVTVDTTAPATPGEPDLAAGSDTGTSNTDNITNDTTPQFIGACESGATVTLNSSVDGDLTPTGACTSGLYDITVTGALSENAHNISASQTDTAGNSSAASSALSVTVDTSGPTVTINQTGSQADPTNTSPVDFAVVFNEPMTGFATGDVALGGTAGATTGTVTETASNNGTANAYNVAVSGMSSDGTVTASIASGVATDASGNGNAASTSTDNEVTYDATVDAPGTPDLAAGSDTGASNTDNITDNTTPQFTGACETGATVTLNSSVDGDLTPTGDCSGGLYDITVTGALSEGTHNITASQEDAAGNSSAASGALSVQIIIPTLTIDIVGVVGTDAVTSSTGTPDPGPIDCPATRCAATFKLDDSVTLNITVDPASGFDGWSGDCTTFGTALGGDITMDDDKTCTAAFSAPDMDIEGNGVSISDGDTTPIAADHTDFGNVAVGNNLDRTFSIQNEGSETLDLTGTPIVQLSGSGDFSVQTQPGGNSIPQGGADLDFVVRCTPGATGERTATISIDNNDPDENPYNFNLSCTGIAPEMDVQRPAETSIPDGGVDELGNQSPGTQTLTYTVDNSAGSDQLSVTGVTAANLTNTSNFALNTAMPINVDAGATGTFDISFDVDANGAFSLDIAIANNDTDENPYQITIQGSGQILPEIEVQGNDQTIADGDTTPISDDHTDFGDVDAAGATVTRTFTVKNTGTADLNLTGVPPRITIGGTHAADFTLDVDVAATVAPDGKTSFTITFDPGAVGQRDAAVSVANNDGDENPYEFTIRGTGTGPAPEMELLGGGVSIPDGDTTPDAADDTEFGAALVDGGIVTHIFTIKNTGSLDLNLTDDPRVTIAGPHAADFNLDIDANTPVAAGGGEIGFSITFNPGAEGLRQATVSIANDDSDENPYNFSIQGTGTVDTDVGDDGISDGGGDDGDGNDGDVSGFDVGSNGGVFTSGPVNVNLFAGTVPDGSKMIIKELSPEDDDTNFQLGERIFDISIEGADGGLITSFDPPLEICVRPTVAELQQVAYNYYLLTIFHSHDGSSWDALYTYPGEDGSVCARVSTLSRFSIGIADIPGTGFEPGEMHTLPTQPEEKAYAELGDFWLEIAELDVALPIVSIPLTEDGWDVSWLGDRAGFLEGTAFPTWAGNTAITAHVWDADNNPGPFVDLHTLQHGDEIVIHAWRQKHVYEVRALTEVRPDDLRALPHSEYDVLTLITCKGFDESSGEYDWRLAVRAVLVDVEAEE